MSKLEMKYPWAVKQCGNCKHIDLTYSYLSSPPKYHCKYFNKPVTAGRTTCLEDDNKKENCDQKNLSCHLEGMAYEHGEIQLDHELRIKDLERKLIDLAFIVKQFDERSAGVGKEQRKINPCEPQTNREDMDFDTGEVFTWEQKERETEQKKKADEVKEQTSNILYNGLRGGNSHWEERIDVIRDLPREEAEKEQKGEHEEEAWHKQMMKFCKESEQRARTLGVIKDEECRFPKELEKRYGGWNEAIREAHQSPIEKIKERLDLLERYLGISKHKMKQTVATLFIEQDKRIEKIEQRLKVLELPETDYRRYQDKIDVQYQPVETDEKQETKEDKKTFEWTEEYDVKKTNPFRCEKCGFKFKIVSPKPIRVDHCPTCGEKPKRIKQEEF